MRSVNCQMFTPIKSELIVNCCGSAALISFVLFLYTFLEASFPFAHATTMSNEQYTVQAGNLNSFAGKASGDGKKITFTSNQTAGLYSKEGINYKVRAGFQYINSDSSFNFSISDISINFGTINAGEPVLRTNTLTISTGSAGGYQIQGIETSELKSKSGNIIPDTSCDAGTCTQTTASDWSNPLTYGFGYRCDDLSGNGCSKDFTIPTSYKRFSNLEKKQIPETIMKNSNPGTNKAQITYKVNISQTQPAGDYQNAIKYIATPSI